MERAAPSFLNISIKTCTPRSLTALLSISSREFFSPAPFGVG